MNPVGIVGAGTMGLSAARRLKEAGHALVVYDPSPKAQAGARALGAEVVASPAAVAAACELALMFLTMPPQVDACVQGPDGLLAQARPGLVIVDLSTVDPDTSRRQAAACRAQGVGYLDAPVKRLAGLDMPIPYNRNLEYHAVPQVENIVEEARILVKGQY